MRNLFETFVVCGWIELFVRRKRIHVFDSGNTASEKHKLLFSVQYCFCCEWMGIFFFLFSIYQLFLP